MATASVPRTELVLEDRSALLTKKIVTIITASTGAGHDTVARNLSGALTEHFQNSVEAQILSLNDVQGVAPLGMLCERLYRGAIIHSPRLWGLIYSITNNRSCWRGARQFVRMSRMDASWLEKPSVIVSVHPIGTQIIAEAIARLPRRPPLVALVTDLFEAHAAWVAPEVDAYVAATPEVGLSLLRQGVDGQKVSTLGLPVDPQFARGPLDRRQERLDRGLDPDCFTILITGGGEGAGSIVATVRAIGEAGLPVQLVVACGRNERLYRRLEAMRIGQRMAVLGFEKNMAHMMHCADILIGKAGALTIVEAIVAGKPTILLPALGGQERGNLRFVSEHGLCASADDTIELVATLKDWMLHSGEMEALTARAAAARMLWVNASRTVADKIGELATSGAAGGCTDGN